MTPRLAAAAIALLVSLGTNGRAAAQDIATIRGVVYACEGDAPIPYVGVTLRRLDDGAVLRLATDRWGRFVDVGLAPGRYLVAVGTGGRSVLAPYDFRENQVLEPASRLARIENDDVLDVRLGTRWIRVPRSGSLSPELTAAAHESTLHARPVCDPPLVPQVPSTADRYIVR